MILRRISESLRRQDWATVLLEIVIVVLGVFIGIEVANWNAANADQREQIRLLSELSADLAADIREIEDVRAAAGIRVKAIEDLLREDEGSARTALSDSEFRYVADGETAEKFAQIPEYQPDNPYAYPIAATFIRTLDGNRHTYETLLNINGFRLIEDRNLVRAIQAYYARVDEVRDLEDFVVESRNDIFEQLHRHGISRISRISFDELQTIVHNDAALYAALGDVQYSSFNQWDAMQSLRRQADDLVSLLSKYD